jgi:hypothetical protein
MRRIPPLLLAALVASVGVALARPGPDTANMLKLAPPAFDLALKGLPACPTPFELSLKRDMPDPGWSLKVDKFDRKAGWVVVHVTATRQDGLFPQVITPASASVNLGRFKKGPHVLEIHYRTGPEAKYELAQVALLRGS